MIYGDFLKAAALGETVRVKRTAVYPLLWLVAFATPLSILGAALFADLWIRVALLASGFLPVLFTIAVYFVYLFRDPDRLQSEQYRFRRRPGPSLVENRLRERGDAGGSMKRHLLIFDEGIVGESDRKSFVDSLDYGAQMYTFDGRVGFLKSRLPAAQISDHFQGFAGSSAFLITDITHSEISGRMYEIFWDFLKESDIPTAAE
ncbi:MAG: hypothetical protein ACLPN5_10875 [Roseiarcus sp.]